MKKIEREEEQKRKSRFSFLTRVGMALTLLLALAQLVLSNQLASFGKELAVLGSEEKRLAFENESSAKVIAKESSIATIAKKASLLELSSPTIFLIVEEQDSLALLHKDTLP